MTAKFPKVSVFTTEKLSSTRVAIYENGEYICQLQSKEVESWLYRARRATEKFAIDEAQITIRRIEIALEYLATRAKRPHNIEAKAQMELF